MDLEKSTKDEDFGLIVIIVIICILAAVMVGALYKGFKDIQRASPQTAAQFSPLPPQ